MMDGQVWPTADRLHSQPQPAVALLPAWCMLGTHARPSWRGAWPPVAAPIHGQSLPSCMCVQHTTVTMGDSSMERCPKTTAMKSCCHTGCWSDLLAE